jgi:hypothetical protein
MSTADAQCMQQALAAAPLSSGASAVLAAETGSGKTLAYLAPLISSLLHERENAEKGGAEQPGGSAGCACAARFAWHASAACHGSTEGGVPCACRPADERASDGVLVLCPNAALCSQVCCMWHAKHRPEEVPCKHRQCAYVTHEKDSVRKYAVPGGCRWWPLRTRSEPNQARRWCARRT